jgi:hypothetical protein
MRERNGIDRTKRRKSRDGTDKGEKVTEAKRKVYRKVIQVWNKKLVEPVEVKSGTLFMSCKILFLRWEITQGNGKIRLEF